jgi:mono/diheme cytochrome c family protein
MYTGLLHTHKLVVTVFLLLYLIKLVLLVLNKFETLQNFSKKTRIAEMIISVLFLVTGIYLGMNSGAIGSWLWVKLLAIAIAIPVAIVGFKRNNKALAAMSVMLIIYSYGVSEIKSPVFKKTKQDNTALADGASIYNAKCSQCHGGDGKSGLSGAKDLTVSTLSFEEKRNVILHGKNAMMGYKGQLTEEQVNAVTGYVEQLKH